MSQTADADDFARRVPPLQGGVNFRDLGGYRTEDGRGVRWGKIYRSGQLSRLTKEDHTYLAGLNIRAVHDLRTGEERAREPNHWATQTGVEYWCRNYKSSFGVLRSLLTSGLPTAEAALAAMRSGYRRLPAEHAPAYRALFARLKGGDVPVVFNCTAGKDRAGTAAALVLHALGVPRETIVRDYCLTEKTLDRTRLGPAKEDHQANKLPPISPEIRAIVMGINPSFINAIFDVIDEQYGTIDIYFRDELALDADGLKTMRDLLLE